MGTVSGKFNPATHIYALVDHPEGYVLSMQINHVLKEKNQCSGFACPEQRGSFFSRERSDTTPDKEWYVISEPLDALLKARGYSCLKPQRNLPLGGIKILGSLSSPS